MTWLEWMLIALIVVWSAVGGVLCFILIENLREKLDDRRYKKDRR